MIWQDLLGMELDDATGCWQLMREVHSRLGLRAAPEVPDGVGYFDPIGLDWRDASRLGDVLASDPRKTGRTSHVATVVSLDPPTVLTSALDGVGHQRPFTMHAAYASRDCGAWRVRP